MCRIVRACQLNKAPPGSAEQVCGQTDHFARNSNSCESSSSSRRRRRSSRGSRSRSLSRSSILILFSLGPVSSSSMTDSLREVAGGGLPVHLYSVADAAYRVSRLSRCNSQKVLRLPGSSKVLGFVSENPRQCSRKRPANPLSSQASGKIILIRRCSSLVLLPA